MDKSVPLLLSVGALAGMHYAFKYLRQQLGKIRDDASMPSKADLIPVLSEIDTKSLITLAESSDANLRRCAEQFIMERFIGNKENIDTLFNECLTGDSLKGCLILMSILGNGSWPPGFDNVAMITMGKLLVQSMKESFTDDIIYRRKIHQFASLALFTSYALEYDPVNKLNLLVNEVPDIASHLVQLIEYSQDKELMRFCLLMIHEFISNDTDRYVIEAGVIAVLCRLFKEQQGDFGFQMMVLQCLLDISVRNNIEPVIIEMKLHLAACLRYDWKEQRKLMKLALAMLSKLSPENLPEIVNIPGIVGAFSRNLNGPIDFQHQVLQVMFVIATDNVDLRYKILHCPEIIENLAVLYQSSDREVCCGALALTQCLLIDAKRNDVMTLLNSSDKLICNLSPLSNLVDTTVQSLVLDILGVFCSFEEGIAKVMNQGALQAILHFCTLSSPDKNVFMVNATGMLLNLIMTSDDMKKAVLEAGGLSVLLSMAWEDNVMNLSIMAAKTLIMLGHSGCSAKINIDCSPDYGTLCNGGEKLIVTNPTFDVVTWSLSTNRLKHCVKFTSNSNISDLSFIGSSESGCLIYIILITGNGHKEAFGEGLKGLNNLMVFKDGNTTLKDILWENKHVIIIGTSDAENLFVQQYKVIHQDSEDSFSTEFDIEYDPMVNKIILEKLTKSMISILLKSRANIAVSKITELELLEVLAHQNLHANAFLTSTEWPDHAKYMILQVAEGLENMHEIEPLSFLHCLATAKLLAVLAVPAADTGSSSFMELIPLLLRVQNAVSNVWIKSMINTLSDHQQLMLTNYNEILQNIARVMMLIFYQISHWINNIPSLGEQIIYSTWSLLLCSESMVKYIEVVAGAIIMRFCCDIHSDNTALCVLSETSCTPSLQLSAHQLQIRNDDWTFESIRTNHSVSAAHDVMHNYCGWYYEVELNSGGIIQLGWATASCQFTPQKGLGVGDDVHSVAYDGFRSKKWNGPLTSNQCSNDYGEKWSEGDTVGCLLSKSGEVSYLLNGQNLGTAFNGLDMSQLWFPAASLSTDQQITFNFGALPFKLKCPSDYLSINRYISILSETSETVEQQLDDETGADPEFLLNERSIPSIYYEINFCQPCSTEVEFGFITGNKSSKVTFRMNRSCLELPDKQKLKVNYPLCIGVGYILYETSLIVTVNGQPLCNKFPISLTAEVHVLPYFNQKRLDINIGSRPFVYNECNDKKYSLTAAALLMDYFILSKESER